MKFRRRIRSDNAQADMTAMIDIVFQLLAFFVMTFKVTALEADFNVKMPISSMSETPIDELLPTLITVNLRADSSRNLVGIDVDSGVAVDSFSGAEAFARLTDFVEKTMAAESDPVSAPEIEVEFSIDAPLRYKYTVQAMESVSGKLLPDKTVKRLVKKIKFRN